MPKYACHPQEGPLLLRVNSLLLRMDSLLLMRDGLNATGGGGFIRRTRTLRKAALEGAKRVVFSRDPGKVRARYSPAAPSASFK
eukprot:446898-Prorocentrum_minimum.AAC.1